MNFEENFQSWKRGVSKYCGDDKAENLISLLGGEKKIMEATFAATVDTGCAGKGQLLWSIFSLLKIGLALNDILPTDRRANTNSLIKVLLLQHISKVELFEEIPMPKGFKLYEFKKDKKSSLRVGEKSTFLCMAAGIQLDEVEWEAMRIIDLKDDDNMAKLFSTQLSNICRMANQMLDMSKNNRGL